MRHDYFIDQSQMFRTKTEDHKRHFYQTGPTDIHIFKFENSYPCTILFNGGQEEARSDRIVRRGRYSYSSKEGSYSRNARFYPKITQGLWSLIDPYLYFRMSCVPYSVG